MSKRTRLLALAAWSLSLGALLPSQAPAATRDLCRDRCAQREYECEIGGYDPNFCYAAYQNCIARCI